MIKLGPPNVRVVHRGRCNSPDCAGGMVGVALFTKYNKTCHGDHFQKDHSIHTTLAYI